MSEDTKRTDKPPSVDRLSLLWRRTNDHKMVQWSVAYVALAYGLQHGVVLTGDAFEWPHMVTSISMLLLVLGLPLVMTLAWYHGARASRRISGPELTIISILLVMSSLLFYVFVRPSAELAAPAAQQAGVTAAGSASASPRGAISIVVLPFANMSGDSSQEFFSDGMTEEITSALAKIADLRVVGRTSAFQFKGEKKDLRAIGQALNATHLIEGSVRKDGNEVRITAQLIRADNGTHLWTESYDRELKGVFAIQEEIATAIASALRVPLGLKEGQNLVSSRTSDTDSYQDYLRARALVRARGPREPGGPLTQAVELLEQVVVRDANYAPAWAMLGQAQGLMPNYSAAFLNGSVDELRRLAQASLPKAEMAARRAIELDPNNADAYTALGIVHGLRNEVAEGQAAYKKALELDPGNPEQLNLTSLEQGYLGHLKDALALRQQLQTLEPFVPIFNRLTAQLLWLNGRTDEAIAIVKALPASNLYRAILLAEMYAAGARYGDAADALLQIPPGVFAPGTVEEAARRLRAAPVRAPQNLPRLGMLSFVFLYTGSPDRMLEYSEGGIEAGYLIAGPEMLWHPALAQTRKTQRFKTFVRKIGLVDEWRAHGWPDLCHPVGADDFACE